MKHLKSDVIVHTFNSGTQEAREEEFEFKASLNYIHVSSKTACAIVTQVKQKILILKGAKTPSYFRNL